MYCAQKFFFLFFFLSTYLSTQFSPPPSIFLSFLISALFDNADLCLPFPFSLSGWIVDSDLDNCMICAKPFSSLYFRFRHHCRACGNLICGECSPYKTRIASLVKEESMSRVCLNCFGLKVTVQDPLEYNKKKASMEFELKQKPLNLEAYRRMRSIIPPNITRTDFNKLKSYRLPDSIVQRIWQTKILWLICMHKDDILKVEKVLI